METTGIIRNIQPEADERLIRTRLGYRPGATVLSQEEENRFNRLLAQSRTDFPVTVAWRRLRILENDGAVVRLETMEDDTDSFPGDTKNHHEEAGSRLEGKDTRLEGTSGYRGRAGNPMRSVDQDNPVTEACQTGLSGLALPGTGIAQLLQGCDEAMVLFSTAGQAPLNQIRKLTAEGNLADAVVLDAAASEIADAGLDWLMQYLNGQLRRASRSLTHHRYSPGYGDLALQAQHVLAALMDIGRFQVTLNEACILVPEKSVLAVAGIVKPEIHCAC